jgi:hypothetical protein
MRQRLFLLLFGLSRSPGKVLFTIGKVVLRSSNVDEAAAGSRVLKIRGESRSLSLLRPHLNSELALLKLDDEEFKEEVIH